MAVRASPLFQCVRSEAPPMLSSACSIFTPRAPASWAIKSGRSLRAVKLLPTKRMRLGRLDDLLIELSSQAYALAFQSSLGGVFSPAPIRKYPPHACPAPPSS